MYKEFFGLKKLPFENTPNPHFLYLSKQHREVLSALLYAVESAKGMVLVAGGVGTGKTTLIQALLKNVAQHHSIIYIINPHTHFNDILKYIAKRVGVPTEGLKAPECMDLIHEELKRQDELGNRAVLIVDEAHLLTEENLENIRLLLNLETEKNKLLQIILVGQNEIYKTLQKPALSSLRQRIVINRKLSSLGCKDTELYIKHRLNVAGKIGKLFDSRAVFRIYKCSNGIPRLINQICDNALLIGFAEQRHVIGRKIIREVVDDMEISFRAEVSFAQKHLWRYAALLGTIIVFSVPLYFWVQFRPQTTDMLLKGSMPSLNHIPDVPIVVHHIRDGRVKKKKVSSLASDPPQVLVTSPAIDAIPAGRGLFGDDSDRSVDDVSDKMLDALASTDLSPHIAPEILDRRAGSVQAVAVPDVLSSDQDRKSDPAHVPNSYAQESNDTFLGKIWNDCSETQVSENDNLGEIIFRFYGRMNSSLIDIVMMANTDIFHPDFLYPGQTIMLPKISQDDIIIECRRNCFYIYYASLNTKNEAEKEVERLKRHSQGAVVAFSPLFKRGNYRIFLGMFSRREEVEDVFTHLKFKYLPLLDESS